MKSVIVSVTVFKQQSQSEGCPRPSDDDDDDDDDDYNDDNDDHQWTAQPPTYCAAELAMIVSAQTGRYLLNIVIIKWDNQFLEHYMHWAFFYFFSPNKVFARLPFMPQKAAFAVK